MRIAKTALRIAFSRGHEYEGAEAVEAFVKSIKADVSFDTSSSDLASAHKIACDTSAMALLSLSEGKADFAILPYIGNESGYAHSVLHDVNSLFDVSATGILRLTETYCLAALADDIAVVRATGNAPYLTNMEILSEKETARACRSALKGFSAQGAKVSIVGSEQISVQTLARSKFSDAAKNERSSFHSSIRAALMPSRLAHGSSRYVVLQDNIQERPLYNWALVFQRAKDESVRLDKYKTTDARTRYFYRRLKKAMSVQQSVKGAGVILRFKRDAHAAAIGDIESYLRNYGVRYEVLDLPIRDYGGAPPPRYLDIEFEAHDLAYNPARRLSGTVVCGALKRAFSRWKSRGVQVVGAMPLHEFRMPAPASRRWWKEGGDAAFRSFANTMFIRWSRLVFSAVLLLLLFGVFAFVFLIFS